MAFSLKDYQILSEIGHGGFASVYRAKQKSLSREVAIKRLSPSRMQNAAEILRFRREAEAMAALTHDNIVSVFDYAYHNGSYYIVMEYIDGMAFDAALDRGVSKECALFILEKTAGALKFAHSQDIIHRDIKPANILLGRNGQVKLADFGLALFSSGIESFTSPGSVLGTISYMAPEALASPKEVDNRVDVFSFGCIIYQVIAGKHPFDGSNFGEISYRILNEEPLPLPAGAVPARLADVTLRCLQKDREKRPAMTEVHDGLAAVMRDGYHEAQETVIAFVRRGSGQKTSWEILRMPLPAAPVQSRKKLPSLRAIAMAVAAAALITMAILLRTSLIGNKHHPQSLPALQSFNSSDTVETARGMPHSKRAQRAQSKNGPAPVTGTALDMKTGTLVIRGLAVQDTVLINDQPVPTSPKGEEAQFELVPGYYHLDIRRKSGPPVLRDLELVPFERQIIDLGKEQR